MPTWIETVPPHAADGRLKEVYDKVAGPKGQVDNILAAHSLRPHTLEGHMALYKAVLHHSGNVVPKWFLECIGIWVSVLNRCNYCVEHHFVGMSRELDDDDRAKAIRKALETSAIDSAPLTEAERLALDYADGLTSGPSFVDEDDVIELRAAGWDDGQILEINQVTAYFNYANRTVLGLGVSTDGETLGLSPSGEDWSHR